MACLKMLDKIGHLSNVPAYVADAKDKTKNVRIMGFGHRVYKNYDPRAKVMQKMAHRLMKKSQSSVCASPLPEDLESESHEAHNKYSTNLEIAAALEKVALNDDYFIKRCLFPNVDFYSGIVLQELGFPRDMFTVMFALARSIGWICHWREMMSEKIIKIGRPRQLYVGDTEREYVHMADRENTAQFEPHMGPTVSLFKVHSRVK